MRSPGHRAGHQFRRKRQPTDSVRLLAGLQWFPKSYSQRGHRRAGDYSEEFSHLRRMSYDLHSGSRVQALVAVSHGRVRWYGVGLGEEAN
jgi:hypothetical protein